MPTPDLQAALHLTPDDRAANRRGELSPLQRQRLRRSGVWNVIGSVGIGLLLGAILFAVAEKPLRPVQWILAGVLEVGALLTALYTVRQLRAAVAGGRVECVTGPVRVFRQKNSGYFLGVGDQTFRLPVRPWHVESGARYRVYVAPAAKRIVAMEPDGPSAATGGSER
jgi:hypothetical protein